MKAFFMVEPVYGEVVFNHLKTYDDVMPHYCFMNKFDDKAMILVDIDDGDFKQHLLNNRVHIKGVTNIFIEIEKS